MVNPFDDIGKTHKEEYLRCQQERKQEEERRRQEELEASRARAALDKQRWEKEGKAREENLKDIEFYEPLIKKVLNQFGEALWGVETLHYPILFGLATRTERRSSFSLYKKSFEKIEHLYVDPYKVWLLHSFSSKEKYFAAIEKGSYGRYTGSIVVGVGSERREHRSYSYSDPGGNYGSSGTIVEDTLIVFEKKSVLAKEECLIQGLKDVFISYQNFKK